MEGFLDELGRLGWRGLLVAHSSDLHGLARRLAGILSRRGPCLLMATKGVREAVGAWGCEAAGPPDLGRVLGREYQNALVAAEGLLRPNIVAGVGETVRAGGGLAVAAPPLEEWRPGPPGGTGLYGEYLRARIGEAPSLLWLDWDGGEVYARRLPGEPAPPPPRGPFKSRAGVPRALHSLARTRDQAAALDAFASFLRGRARTLMVTGDRGRGKSFLVGLGVALAIHWHAAGRVEVVAPSEESASSLMRGLVAGLEALQAPYRVRGERGGVPVRVTGPWFRVALATPERAEPAPMLVVDEAGAVGVARVRRLSWRSGKVVVATTIHGYEGSGRALAHLLKTQLPQPLAEARLEEPIRYRPGDPLEAWLYDTFMLRAEPRPPPREVEDAQCGAVNRRVMARDRGVLEGVVGLLALAHYRSEPDDILVMLESPNHRVYALGDPASPIAVADVAVEEWGMEEAARLGLKALEHHAHGAAHGLRGVRVVRIAVHPDLQRRGHGSRLLRCVEGEAARAGADVVTTIFSRHDVIGFWVRNGYRPVYMSPRYNRVTGEKNVAFARPLTPRGAAAVEAASSAFRLRLLLSAHSIYRDVAAEKIPLLIESAAPARAPLALTPEQAERLRMALEGVVDYEQASDAAFIAVVACLASKGPLSAGLTAEEAAALAARVLQGKPLDDVAAVLGSTPHQASEVAVRALRKLLAGPCRPPLAPGEEPAEEAGAPRLD